jgi:hypothetical protein
LFIVIYSIPDKYFGQKPLRFAKPLRFRAQGFFWNTIFLEYYISEFDIMRNILLLFLLFFVPMSVYAYIGPGMGAGTIGVIIGILMSIFLALFAILWYPFKRLLKKKKKSDTDDSKVDSEPS